MKTLSRLLLIVCIALPFSACKKAEAPAPVAKAAMSAPKTDDRQAWVDYLNDVVSRNRGNIANEPFVYFLPGESSPDFAGQYERLADKAQSDVARGIISGNMLTYASPASAKMADMVTTAFQGVPADSMKGVKLLFVGQPSDNERVQIAVAPAGVDYVFIDTSK